MRWRFRLSESEFGVVHRAGIRYQAADALSRRETGVTDTIKVNDDLPEILIALIEHRGEKMSNDQDVKYDSYCIFPQDFDTV